MQKTKTKIAILVDLPSAMVMALGKAGKLCRVPGHCTRQRFFFKKKQKIFAECQAGEALGKEFLKKNKK